LAREEALAAFTAAPAFASGDLHALGTLSPGKLADFVIFDRNLVTCDPEELLEATAQCTAIGGRPRWVNGAWAPGRAIQEALGESAR
jgi:predicted amidohydrolase YtcJ